MHAIWRLIAIISMTQCEILYLHRRFLLTLDVSIFHELWIYDWWGAAPLYAFSLSLSLSLSLPLFSGTFIDLSNFLNACQITNQSCQSSSSRARIIAILRLYYLWCNTGNWFAIFFQKEQNVLFTQKKWFC